MDYKKITTDQEAITRNLSDFDKETENIYESVVILSKRADQIGLDLRNELLTKIEDFQTPTDSLEEVFENREQIELARFYEQLPKPTLLAIYEFLNDKINYRYPDEEEVEIKNIHPDELKEKKIEESNK
ncbi:MAG: DNA-directed RNA polymerase subunit omega [Bacteroidales bacterium]|jgi:DNA-directed RNA polymerase subunit K/omega